MTVENLLSRQVYLYSDVDRLVGLPTGTARRWINGYERSGRRYDPILRVKSQETEWATWGEFVETRILAEYRDKSIRTTRLRSAVEQLRRIFDMDYPLAHLRPYLAADAGELTIDRTRLDPLDDEGRLALRTSQLLLSAPGQEVMQHAMLAVDSQGEKFAAELTSDPDFEGIVVNPERLGGQPTFTGRRVSVATIAGMLAAGDNPVELAAGYGLSIAQVQAAQGYATAHLLIA